MTICIPVLEDRGMESIPHSHFGSAPRFLLFDPDSNELSSVDNGNADHQHGKCDPASALSATGASVVIVGGIGGRAVERLNAAGVRVYRALKGSAGENLDGFTGGLLEEISPEGACGHAGGHTCN